MTLEKKNNIIQNYCDSINGKCENCIIADICNPIHGCFVYYLDEVEKAYGILCPSDSTKERIPKPAIESRKHKIQLKDIKIPASFEATMPNPEKLKEKYEMYYKNGHFNTDIIIDEHNILVDGYCNYLIYKMFNVFEVTVIKIKVKKDV